MANRTSVPKKAPMTATERSRAFRRRKKMSANYKVEDERRETRERVRAIRARQGKSEEKCSQTCKDPECTLHAERDRKRAYRMKKSGKKIDGRTADGLRRRKEEQRKSLEEMECLKISVRSLTNERRRLKRRRKRAMSQEERQQDESMDVEEEEEEEEEVAGGSGVGVDFVVGGVGDRDEDSEEEPLMSSSLLGVMSPHAKKKVFRRLSQGQNYTTVKKQLRKEGHRINLRDSMTERGQESVVRAALKRKVEAFLDEDSNSIPCPDKKKVGVRYRLDFLCTLHEKFMSELNVDCSYEQFTRLVPPHIKKPKPTDWGTCLCMICLNPQLMLEGLKRSLPGAFTGVSIEDYLITCSDKELNEFTEKILKEKDKNKKNIAYLHWEKVKTTREMDEEEKDQEDKGGEKNKQGGASKEQDSDKDSQKKKNKRKKVTYLSEKKSIVDSRAVFAEKLVASLKVLREHTTRRIAQYRRIKDIRTYVDDTNNNAAAFRIDWSENAKLYQTRQEKGAYYHDLQVSINTLVGYEPDGVTISYASLSDHTCHKSAATWASLRGILPDKYQKLFLISDSPTSQYRNKFNVFLAKKWAIEHRVDITWVFTETGHGKGPMDGVGGSMKRSIDHVIAFNPNDVIRDTATLIRYLPDSEIQITTYTQEDVLSFQKVLPKKKALTLEASKRGVSISKVHEISIPSASEDQVFWKALSSDPDFVPATMKIKRYAHSSNSTSSKNTAAAIEVGTAAIEVGTTNAVASDNEESSDEDDDDEDVELEVDLAVLVSYEGSLFPGKITEVMSETHVRVSCMVMAGPVAGGSKSLWKWPQHVDTNIYPICDVRMRNISMNIQPGTERNITFHVPELDHIWGVKSCNSDMS